MVDRLTRENGQQHRSRVAAFLRFLVIGGSCFLLGLLLLYILTEIGGLHYLISLALSLVVVNLVGWLLNRAWTFNVGVPRTFSEFTRYLLVNLLGFAITLMAVHGLVAHYGMHYFLASGIVAVAMTVFNFVAHRVFSFRL